MGAAAFHYSRADVLQAIGAVGIVPGDIVSLQASLGRLGMAENARSMRDVAILIIDTFREALGSEGTLIVPTYTYSVGRGELFEVEKTPSAIGEFTEIFRTLPGVVRSRDPMLSTAGIGPHASDVLRNVSKSCYGADSTFDRLKQAGAKICTLGLGLYWATFRHHIEEMAEVPFRFRKRFTGSVREGGVTTRETWTYYAAPLQENCEPNGLPLEERARAAGLAVAAPLGRGELIAIDAREYFDFGVHQLSSDPWLTAKGPACSVSDLARRENSRIAATECSVRIPPQATARDLVASLSKVPRDIVSAGFDAALSAIALEMPLEVHEYPSGTQVGEEIVPEKWTCRAAYVRNAEGLQILSYMDDPNHVAAYSRPFHGTVSREELISHLSVSRGSGDEVEFRSVLDQGTWALCCSALQFERLTTEHYEVLIDCATSYGLLKVGECLVPGESDRSVLLVARLDRQADPFRGAGGAAVAMTVVRILRTGSVPHRSVRLLFVPGSIALEAWVATHANAISDTGGAIYLNTSASLRNPVLTTPSLLLAEIALESHSVSVDEVQLREPLSIPDLEDAARRILDLLQVTTETPRQ